MRPRSLGRLISITSTLRARLSVPVSTKGKTHPIHDPPAGNLPDRSYGSRRHPPNLWALPAEPAITLGGTLGPLRHSFRPAFQAPHLRPLLRERRPYTRPSPVGQGQWREP